MHAHAACAYAFDIASCSSAARVLFKHASNISTSMHVLFTSCGTACNMVVVVDVRDSRCRLYLIHLLPNLIRLDAIEVTAAERAAGVQHFTTDQVGAGVAAGVVWVWARPLECARGR